MADLMCPKCKAPLRARVQEIISTLVGVDEDGAPVYSTLDGEVQESDVLEVFCSWCGWKATWEQALQGAVREPDPVQEV